MPKPDAPSIHSGLDSPHTKRSWPITGDYAHNPVNECNRDFTPTTLKNRKAQRDHSFADLERQRGIGYDRRLNSVSFWELRAFYLVPYCRTRYGAALQATTPVVVRVVTPAVFGSKWITASDEEQKRRTPV
jgi:hypothetical protein